MATYGGGSKTAQALWLIRHKRLTIEEASNRVGIDESGVRKVIRLKNLYVREPITGKPVLPTMIDAKALEKATAHLARDIAAALKRFDEHLAKIMPEGKRKT